MQMCGRNNLEKLIRRSHLCTGERKANEAKFSRYIARSAAKQLTVFKDGKLKVYNRI
jgi:hypothetical protein